MFIHHKGKDDLMGPQEGDERQSGLGKSGDRARRLVSFRHAAQTALSLCAHPLCYLSHEHSSLKMPWTGCLGVCGGPWCRGQDSRSPEAAKNREKSLGIAHQAWVGKEGYTGLQTECPRVSLWWKGRPRAPLQST